MKLTQTLMHEWRKSISLHWPLFLPVGTIEFHGEHLPLGVDGTVVEKALEEVERRISCVIAPTIWYGAGSYFVAGPERGSIDVDLDNLERHVEDILRGFMENGFQRIFVVIHHQFAKGRQMPTTLACKKAAMKVTSEFTNEKRGKGWWGFGEVSASPGKDDTARTAGTVSNPLDAIQVVPLMSEAIQDSMGYDHAGRLETSMMLACAPDEVDMTHLKDENLWFTADATDASRDYGTAAFKMIVDYLVDIAGR